MEESKLPEFIDRKFEEKDKNPAVLEEPEVRSAVMQVIDLLDRGKLRVAMPPHTGDNHTDQWRVNAWVKKAILMYFPIQGMQTMHSGDIEYWDKIPTKKNYAAQKVRVVPPAVARYGSFLEPGAIMMPSYVNIGAYVGSGTMVDTWATVGSCAQIGQNVHLSGGVGIGGVLEPPQGLPVIIEDHAFLGSRCVVVEGVHVSRGAVLGSGVILTASTKIIDVSKSETQTYKGFVPRNAVVIPGSYAKKFPGGEFQVPCALVIGERKESTDLKTSLNNALRDFEVSV
jgi:2,3,4,5-tetrahydropyridine-2-carboxylate N-succinyltransferase